MSVPRRDKRYQLQSSGSEEYRRDLISMNVVLSSKWEFGLGYNLAILWFGNMTKLVRFTKQFIPKRSSGGKNTTLQCQAQNPGNFGNRQIVLMAKIVSI